ncbi:UDP-N-acetylmuramoyl-L-alanine--D-glutamate ligase [Akkermansia sp.]|uniref:UDP-N-acetylmuramoyl-L-alanine--D-glutamate ligase n=1 Tax=Akkermansia sp. TaxID=1872421 RepID=UPI00266BE1BE|nr:UDP-N-acetylmuramoyl-L-alanine--D-glutamate ligase [Akkermansia sp.]MEE0765144.1 UDP-N-acetylmuramoyl-L-alanine--D-glutamate ligase [Akkermansia sp.]
MNLHDLNIAVLGAGRSGRAAARLAMKHGGRVCVFDTSPAITGWPEDIPLHAGATQEDGHAFRADLVVISPGIETDCPFVKSFGREGVETIGEMELASRFYRGKIIAITGTNGKTTTTSLVEKILLRAGKKAVACGNYGVPMAEVLLRDAVPDVLALEVSSFQLETIRNFHPDVAVWLNFAPDHMDRYTAVEDYYKAKLHIFDNQTKNDLAVVRFGEHLPALKAPVRTFSSESPEADLYYREPLVMGGGSPLLNLAGTSLSQRHNAENVMAAVLACRHLGIPAETAAEVLEEFTPPGHRCEAVRTLDGVLWLNDSKATNLHALKAALKSQNAPVVLIAGGKDKGLDYLPLRSMLKEKVRACVVFGQIADQLYDSFSPAAPTEKAADVADCVEKARLLARPGDTVLFSPGTSSFDMFTGYAQRGQAFRDAVNALSPLS